MTAPTRSGAARQGHKQPGSPALKARPRFGNSSQALRSPWWAAGAWVSAVAKSDPARLGVYAQERGWRNLRLLSTRNNTFNRDYHAETPEGEQLPVLNVFARDEDGIHHRWASELTFVRGDSSPLDPVWPIWGVLDLTPNGRGETAAYPSLQYE
jgi:predicted dithiol-disulfide oxidoreductase (DUF899 family)